MAAAKLPYSLFFFSFSFTTFYHEIEPFSKCSSKTLNTQQKEEHFDGHVSLLLLLRVGQRESSLHKAINRRERTRWGEKSSSLSYFIGIDVINIFKERVMCAIKSRKHDDVPIIGFKYHFELDLTRLNEGAFSKFQLNLIKAKCFIIKKREKKKKVTVTNEMMMIMIMCSR